MRNQTTFELEYPATTIFHRIDSHRDAVRLRSVFPEVGEHPAVVSKPPVDATVETRIGPRRNQYLVSAAGLENPRATIFPVG
jgi:hypothetical protein